MEDPLRFIRRPFPMAKHRPSLNGTPAIAEWFSLDRADGRIISPTYSYCSSVKRARERGWVPGSGRQQSAEPTTPTERLHVGNRYDR